MARQARENHEAERFPHAVAVPYRLCLYLRIATNGSDGLIGYGFMPGGSPLDDKDGLSKRLIGAKEGCACLDLCSGSSIGRAVLSETRRYVHFPNPASFPSTYRYLCANF